MRPGLRVALASLIALPLLFGCVPKKPLPDDDGPDIPSPEVKLQVAAIDPAFAPAARELSAEIFGTGFESGARVSVGGADASNVRFVDENALRVTVPPMPAGSYDITVINPGGDKSTLRKGLTLTDAGDAQAGCTGTTVQFELDSTVLSTQTRQEIDKIAACLRNSQGSVRIEGHCDERGTTEYNIALGQRRAEAVQRYLVGQGVSPNRLRTVSYGEERPVDRSGSEIAFARNRRAEILVRE
jgi:peptidoglycan-associated lipoprotein